MRVRDIMRKDFVWFNGGDSFAHVLSRLAQNNISSAPVFHEGKFVGVLSVDEMVRKFSHRDFSNLWRRNKTTPIERMKQMVALEFAKRPHKTLLPDQKLEAVLPVLASASDGVPVVDGKNMVGIVRPNDVIKFMLSEVAKDAHKHEVGISPHAKGEAKSKAALSDVSSASLGGAASASSMDTAIDKLLSLVKSEREIKVEDAASRLGLPRLTVERMGQTLSRHHLMKMEYPLFSGAKMRLVENDKI